MLCWDPALHAPAPVQTPQLASRALPTPTASPVPWERWACFCVLVTSRGAMGRWLLTLR